MGACMKRNAKLAVMPNPKGRVDLLLSGLVEESVKLLVAPRSQELWNVLKPYVSQAAAKQIRKLGVSKRVLSPEELGTLQKLLSPERSFPCTG